MTLDDDTRKLIDQALKEVKPRGLHKTLFNMADCYSQTAKLAMSQGFATKNVDFAGPAIMCKSFAIELLLKFFIAAQHPGARSVAEIEDAGETLKGHDFAVLFRRIATIHQAQIAANRLARPCCAGHYP
jgi:hypothetical protein